MLLELGRALSFFFSILSLGPVLVSAFFVPGSPWRERLAMALLKLGIAACVCFGSGLLFAWPAPEGRNTQAWVSTLPVRLFFWAMTGIATLFALSWYLEEYYAPFLKHVCCRP